MQLFVTRDSGAFAEHVGGFLADRPIAHAFCRDAGVPAIGVESGVDRRLREGHISVWEDEGVVSMVGRRSAVAGVVRLGPVYTPPEARGHGYATALVAEVSRRALAAGATTCMLYTDLANPTSDAIYRAVGYQRSSDAREYVFTSAWRQPATWVPPATTAMFLSLYCE